MGSRVVPEDEPIAVDVPFAVDGPIDVDEVDPFAGPRLAVPDA